MHIRNNKIFFFFFIFFFAISCNKEKESVDIKYGVKFNNTRQKVGLIPLSENWVHLPIDNDGRIWRYDPNVDSTEVILKAYYSTKTTLVRGDTLINETDAFISPNTYENDYGKYNLLLLYTYLFVPDEECPIGWVYYFSAENYNKNISQYEADSILSSWGLSYPVLRHLQSRSNYY
jgi:hypothetical protein